MTEKTRILFSDFDGTITARESLEAVLKQFVPQKYDDMMKRLKAREVTIRKGVREMVEAVPSAKYPEIIEFVKEIPIRPGFEALLDFLDARRMLFIVLSGGLRGMVEARLGPLVKRAHRIIAADVDTSGQYLKIFSDYEFGTELVAKVEVMKEYTADQQIVIGDGITDFQMAEHAGIVFARDSLAAYLDEANVSYFAWSDFFDIRDKLQELL